MFGDEDEIPGLSLQYPYNQNLTGPGISGTAQLLPPPPTDPQVSELAWHPNASLTVQSAMNSTEDVEMAPPPTVVPTISVGVDAPDNGSTATDTKPTKRRKKDASEVSPNSKRVKITIPKLPKSDQKSRTLAKARDGATVRDSSSWRVVPAVSGAATSAKPSKATASASRTNLKPRIWASSRDDLLGILPELAASKSVNGISWMLSETPVLFLEDKVPINIYPDVENGGGTMEITMLRDFSFTENDIPLPVEGSFSTEPLYDTTKWRMARHLNTFIGEPGVFSHQAVSKTRIALAEKEVVSIQNPRLVSAPQEVVHDLLSLPQITMRSNSAPPLHLFKHNPSDKAIFSSAPQTPVPSPIIPDKPPLSINTQVARRSSGRPSEAHRTPTLSAGPSPKLPTTIRDQILPCVLPEEIQVLIDAYEQKIPILCIASRSFFTKKWQISVAEEYEFVYLGYFGIKTLWERRVPLLRNFTEVGKQPGSFDARVEWRFRMEFRPGGHEVMSPNNGSCFLEPWWFTTSPKELEKRSCSGDSVYQSLLPLHVLAPLGLSDEYFPKGWYCEDCGKLNFQACLRHRKCSSSFCKKKPLVKGYALSINRLRDPQESLPLSLPYNSCPVAIDPLVTTWKDGMKTLTYTMSPNGSGVLKHIFTGNYPALQHTALRLLEEIQSNVLLSRQPNDAGMAPYFKQNVLFRRVSKDVPQCVKDAKEFMLNLGSAYGEKDKKRLSINHISFLAWVTSGTRKGPSSINARRRDMFIMCLGCEAVITLTTKVKPASKKKALLDSPGLLAMEDVEMEDVDSKVVAPGRSRKSEDGKRGSIVVPSQFMESQVNAAQAAPVDIKTLKSTFVITLLHGDLLMLFGDEFEYSLQRSGTSILLIGSHKEGS